MARIFVSTAEVSGDLHGATLVERLRRDRPDLEVDALGGDRLRAAGARIVTDLSTQSSIGITEGLRYLGSSLGLLQRMEALFREKRYDLVILVDGQGRNIPLGEAAKKVGLRTAYFFPPPVSVWGRWNVAKMRIHDLLLNPFLEDHLLYERGGCRSVHTGHPFCAYPVAPDAKAAKTSLRLDAARPVLGLFPGSRHQEIEGLAEVFLRTGREIRRRGPDVQVLVSVSHGEFRRKLEETARRVGSDALFVEGRHLESMIASEALLMSSGTATLQAAFLERPLAIAYRISPVSFWLARLLTYRGWAGLPNLMADREICREFFNGELRVGDLADHLEPLLRPGEIRNAQVEALRAVRRKMHVDDVPGRIAAAIEPFLAG